MQIEKTNLYPHKLISRIHDPGYKEKHDRKFHHWPIRLTLFVFIVVNFHWFNKYPILQLNVITVTELLFFVYGIVLFHFFRDKLTVQAQIPKIIFDFLFITFFEYLALSIFGSHSGLYVLYLIPIIYCSFWFNWIFSFSFVTLISIVYCALSYYILEMGKEFQKLHQIAKILSPIVFIFYLVVLGVSYYKRRIQTYYEHVEKEVQLRTIELRREKDYTYNLLKSSFDAIIGVGKNGKIEEINERACELLGYERKDILEEKVKKFYAPGEARRVMLALRNSENGSIENFDTYILNKDGVRIPIRLSAVFSYEKELSLRERLEKGELLPTIGYFRDMRVEKVLDYISKELTSITDEQKLLDEIVKIIAETVKAETCNLFTFDERSGLLMLMSSYGMPEAFRRGGKLEFYKRNGGMTAKVFFENMPVNISNIDVNKEAPGGVGIKWKYAKGFARNSRFEDYRHYLGIPLVVQGEVYGVIRLLNKYTGDNELDAEGFTDNDQKLLERIANRVSILVEKVRDKGRFDAISNVGKELNEMLALPIDKLLKLIAKEVVEGMQFKACYLWLIEDGDNLKIKACYGVKEKYTNNEKYNLRIGKGISGEVIKTGEYLVIKDLDKEERFAHREILEREKLKSMLSVPLKYRDRIIGVINCYTRRIHEFTKQEIQIMNTFAAYVSTAIQNKRRIDELYALSEIGGELVKPINVDKLFSLILERAKELSGADRLCLKLYDEREKVLKTISSLNCGWHKKYEDYTIDVSEGLGSEILGGILNSGDSHIIPDFGEIREKIRGIPDREYLKKVNSYALVPIKIGSNVFGIFFLESFRKNFFMEEDDLLALKAFSTYAAIALRNASLFDKLQRVTGTFPKISELDIDINKVLQNVVGIAAEVLDTDILILYRWDEKKKSIIWPPIYTGGIRHEEIMITEAVSSDTPMLLIQRGVSHYAENSQKDPFMISKGIPLKEGVSDRFVFREGIVSSAGIVLKVGHEIVGGMFINYRTPHKFDEDEIKIIENYASYIAIAIQNVLHFQAKIEADKKAIKAERLAALGQAAGFVAHNAKNDLGAAQIYVNQLEKKISRKGVTDFNKNFEDIQRNLKNANTALVDLLDLSKKPELRKKFLSLSAAFKDTFKGFFYEAESYKRKFSTEIEKNLPLISLDEKKINQVFKNLFRNSIEATQEGGIIKVEFKTMDHKLIIFWEDSGKGIQEKELEKVFEVFYSTKNSWGIGLAYCKKIIEEHDGKLCVDREFNEGCRFIIELPLGSNYSVKERNR